MPRRNPTLIDSAYDLFQLTPIWLGPLAAAAAFLAIWFSPDFFHAAPNDLLYRPFMHTCALIVAGILLFAWAIITLLRIFSRK